MTILIVGSQGFVGSFLSLYLRGIGLDVLCSSSADGIFDLNSGLISEDFRPSVKISSVIYLSQSPQYRDLPKSLHHVTNVNAVSPASLFSRLAGVGVEKFIYFSTGTVYADSFDPMAETFDKTTTNLYGLTKLYGESLVSATVPHEKLFIFRPFCIYGPNQSDKLIPSLTQRIANELPITLASDDENGKSLAENCGLVISLVHVEDVCKVVGSALKDAISPGIYNLCSDEALSIRRISEIISRKVGKQPYFLDSPEGRKGDLIGDVRRLESQLDMPYIRLESYMQSI